ncbi:uncharacterized protein G2W53_016308 [Senna tora]|uniref:Uncharacterized protein n=1 Tax=Senna tora TaxID=362788 RepID=A0A834TP81_9FABA|nr:uncharacterized protein G2W53_016308 [Senna tora]
MDSEEVGLMFEEEGTVGVEKG